MNYILPNLLALVVVSIVFFSAITTGRKKEYSNQVEKEYQEIMEDMACCETLAQLISCQSRINYFRDNDSWKAKDGCAMVDSLQDYYNTIYDNIVYEQYCY